VIRIYDEADNVIETHERKVDLKNGEVFGSHCPAKTDFQCFRFYRTAPSQQAD